MMSPNRTIRKNILQAKAMNVPVFFLRWKLITNTKHFFQGYAYHY
jgi:hypothetical protein